MAIVSIITATIDRASLKNACESINEQTFNDWEHYVLGDGVLPKDYKHSQRTTMGFSRAIGKEEPGINMPDGTPNPILRWALDHISLSKYVCFLDDDNIYKPTYLEKMVSALKLNPDVGIAICGVEDYRYGQNIDGYPSYGRCDNSGFLARSNVAKSVGFPKANKDKEVIQDCEFIAECATRYGWIHVPEKLVLFGINPNIPSLRGGIKLLESWSEPLRASILTRNGFYKDSIDMLKKAIDLDPFDAWSLWHLGEAFFFAGEESKGKQIWKQWIHIVYENNKLDYHWIQYCYALANIVTSQPTIGYKILGRAIHDVTKIASQEPFNCDVAFNVGLYNLLMGQVPDSLQAYRMTIRKLPQIKEIENAIWKLEVLNQVGLKVAGIRETLNILKSF